MFADVDTKKIKLDYLIPLIIFFLHEFAYETPHSFTYNEVIRVNYVFPCELCVSGIITCNTNIETTFAIQSDSSTELNKLREFYLFVVEDPTIVWERDGFSLTGF